MFGTDGRLNKTDPNSLEKTKSTAPGVFGVTGFGGSCTRDKKSMPTMKLVVDAAFTFAWMLSALGYFCFCNPVPFVDGKKLLSGRTPRLSMGRRANFTSTVSAFPSAGTSRTNRAPVLLVSFGVMRPELSVDACRVGMSALVIVASAGLRLTNLTIRIPRARE